ncbi:MAG: hypothetical protein ACYDAB_16180 [bacterium]
MNTLRFRLQRLLAVGRRDTVPGAAFDPEQLDVLRSSGLGIADLDEDIRRFAALREAADLIDVRALPAGRTP